MKKRLHHLGVLMDKFIECVVYTLCITLVFCSLMISFGVLFRII
ncbi:30S ribosomal protein S4 [Escherichia phage IMM-001]|nr:30S ribosomal protein S4 [Escherichia phage IMM-001]